MANKELCWFCSEYAFMSGACEACHKRGLRVLEEQRRKKYPGVPPKPPHTPHHH